MGLLWLLVITYLSCVFGDLYAESSENVEFSEDSDFIRSSLFGFRPCLDEDCNDLPDKTSDFIDEELALQDSAGSEYTPKHSKGASPDTVVEYCLPLHISTLRDIYIIEKRHPDIKDVKLKVIEGVLAYIAQYSVLHAEDCDAAIKLLDFILLATQALRHEYVGDYGKTCNYTEITNGKSVEHPDQSEVTTTTSKCTDTPGVTPDYVSTEADHKPCYPEEKEHNVTDSYVEATVTPCPELPEETDETIAEDGHDYPSPLFVGSVRGIPGVHYPNYTDVPVTSFSCADKKYVPGFYADLETGCQVFHVCYEHRRESFLCPVGTIFNQPILACDYWYSSNCSLATTYYEVNAKAEEATEEEEMNLAVGELISVLVEDKHEKDTEDTLHEPSPPQPEVDITKFFPVKAKVTEFTKPASEAPSVASAVSPQALDVEEVASQIFNKMVSSATNLVSHTRGIIGKVPDSELLSGMKGKLETADGGIAIKPVFAKAKLAAAAVSVPAAKVAAAKATVPVAATAKLAAAAAKVAAAKAVVPAVATAKLAAAAKVSVPIITKAKLAMAAASVPAAKAAAVKVAVPIAVKAKLATVPLKAAVPVVAKAKFAAKSVPIAKVAAAKTVPIAVKTKLAAVPKVAMKASVPVLKSKMVASVLKGKKLKAASTPYC